MASQPVKQAITVYILPDISINKCNQTMTFDQSTEYDMRNIFLEKSYTK